MMYSTLLVSLVASSSACTETFYIVLLLHPSSTSALSHSQALRKL